MQNKTRANIHVLAPEPVFKFAPIDSLLNKRAIKGTYLVDNRSIIEYLAHVDAVYILFPDLSHDRKTYPHLDTLEDIAWYALMNQIPMHYIASDRAELMNPKLELEKTQASARYEKMLAARQKYTARQKELHIYCDYGSSGIWDEHGANYHIDTLDIPMNILRKITKIQNEYDDHLCINDPEWEQHYKATLDSIILELQAHFGSRIKIC